MSRKAQRLICSELCYLVFHLIVSGVMPVLNKIVGRGFSQSGNVSAGLSERERELIVKHAETLHDEAELFRRLGHRFSQR